MANLTHNQLMEQMKNQSNIRNISVISQIDHGKQTLIDQLLSKAGINLTDQPKEEIIINKCANLSLFYQYDRQLNGTMESFILNLIDFPQSQNLCSLPGLRISDGVLIVVDYVEGVCSQTQSALQVIMKEKIKPVLMINKLDRAILLMQQDGETIYQSLQETIERINVIIYAYQQDDMGNLLIRPEEGQVSFGSGKEGWAFTCSQFSEIYAYKFNTESKKLQEKFWGDNYFEVETKCWKKENYSSTGKELKRAFVAFILDPICKMMKAIIDGNIEVVKKMLNSLKIELNEAEQNLVGQSLLQTVMSKWLNVSDNLIQMMILHIPSPKQAQKYRTSYLYEGSQNNDIAQSIRDCNPQGPLVIYISDVLHVGRENYIAFGRIFSGTIKLDQKIRIMGPNFKPCSKEDMFIRQIGRTVLMNSKRIGFIEQDIPCGNLIGLIGDFNILTPSSTISDHPECHLIRSIKCSASPVVKVSVQTKKPQELPKLLEGLRLLAQTNQTIEYSIEDSGQHFIAGCSDLHIEVGLNELQTYFNCTEIIKSDPIIIYKETVTTQSKVVCMAQSQNKNNRLYAQAVPLDENLQIAIEKGLITNNQGSRANILVNEYSWNKDEALKLWAFGPDDISPNILCNQTTTVEYMNEIKESMKFAWQISTKEGALCQENLRGVRVNILDCILQENAIQRGGAEIIQTARRLYSICELTAEPRIQEPILLTEVYVPNQVTAGVYQCLSMRQGVIIEEEQIIGTQLTHIKSYISVAQSFGLATHLRVLTQGQAFPSYLFDHWAIINNDPFELGSQANELVQNIRKRKGLEIQLPNLQQYLQQT